MNCQPDCWLLRVCPFHPVPAMRGDVDEIAWGQRECFRRVFEAENGFALQKHHPFALGLVVPETLGAALASRNNSFDAQAGAIEQI